MLLPPHGSRRVIAGLGTLAALLALIAAATPASAAVSRNVTLLSHMHQYEEYSACWSYVHSDGREYVVINALKGASIVRLTKPERPVEVAFIPLPETFWHEVKQYRHYLYIVTDGAFNGHHALEIIDMRDPDRPRRVGNFNPDLGFIHTVSVDDDRGLLFLNGMPPEVQDERGIRQLKFELEQGLRHAEPGFGTMHIYSLADPEHPVELSHYAEYVHDFHVRGTRGYASLIYDGFVAVLDLTDPSNPVEIARWRSPNFFAHSTWTTEDGRYLYLCDETPGPNSLSVWDITDLTNPRLTYLHQELAPSIPHNPRVRGDVLFISHYTEGVRVWDISNPAWPVETGWYDTHPGTSGDYLGAWEVAPYFPSGIFVVSDINTGLYVFRSAPKNYGIVRGKVRDGSNGPPLGGVRVTVEPGGQTFRTHADGTFAFALDAPGSYTLAFSLFRFEDETRSVRSVSVGSDRTLTVSLKRTPTGTIQGTVTAQSNGAPLAGAELIIDGHSSDLRAESDAFGAYRIESVPVGSYTVRCLRPAHVPAAAAVTVTPGRTTSNFALAAATWYDDAETDRGWSLADADDTALTGRWIRAVPLPSVIFTGQVTQPGADHTPGSGTTCFVTGNYPDPRFILNESVFGKTTLTSPVVSLAGLSDPRVGFWAWYTNEILGFPFIVDDVLTIRVSGDGGATWVTAAAYPRNTNGWRYFEVQVRDVLPTASTVRVKVIASQLGAFNLVEATLDDFAIYSGGAGAEPFTRLASAPELVDRRAPVSNAIQFGRVGPVPSRGAVHAALELTRAANVTTEVFDVRGRLVRSVPAVSLPAGRHRIGWDGRLENGTAAGAGVYWLKLRAEGVEKTTKVVLLR